MKIKKAMCFSHRLVDIISYCDWYLHFSGWLGVTWWLIETFESSQRGCYFLKGVCVCVSKQYTFLNDFFI